MLRVCVLVSSLKVKMLMSIGDEARNKMPLGHNVMDPGIRQTVSISFLPLNNYDCRQVMKPLSIWDFSWRKGIDVPVVSTV